jgi:DNA polymerase-4
LSFFLWTKCLFGGKYQLVEKIRKRIRNEIGEYITVSVGVSHNKLLAKLASGINKPNGMLEITSKSVRGVYAKVKLTDFCGIGKRIEERLNRLGIHTPLELHNTPLDVLIHEFKDVEGHFLYELGQGQDDSVVIPYYFPSETKSVGRNYCLPQNQYDQRLVMQNVYELCEEVALKLRKLNKKARTAGIYLGGSKNVHGRKTTGEYFDSGQEMFALCQKILTENGFCFSDSDYVRRISVWIGSLKESSCLQASLFDFDVKKNKLTKTVDKINEKFGDHTIRNGFLLNADKLTTVPNGFMADRYERQKIAEEFNPKLT